MVLRENEKIVKIVRRHGSVMTGTVIKAVIAASLVVFVILKFGFDVFVYSGEIVAGAVLIATVIILYKIYVWRKNTLVITDQRVILNLQNGLFSKTVTELLYRDIFDISFKQSGILALIFQYGRLVIKTPSGSEITFDKVASPAQVVQIINGIRANASVGPVPLR